MKVVLHNIASKLDRLIDHHGHNNIEYIELNVMEYDELVGYELTKINSPRKAHLVIKKEEVEGEPLAVSAYAVMDTYLSIPVRVDGKTGANPKYHLSYEEYKLRVDK